MTWTPPAFDAQLKTAISDKRLLQLRYHDHMRVVEPHDYGLQRGIGRLLVYQLRATPPSSSARSPQWRLLTVSEIDEVAVLDNHFGGSRGASHQHHYAWDLVFARVS